MHACMHACMHAYIHTYIYIYIYIYITNLKISWHAGIAIAELVVAWGLHTPADFKRCILRSVAYLYIYIYIYIEREREIDYREREVDREGEKEIDADALSAQHTRIPPPGTPSHAARPRQGAGFAG